MESTLLHVIAPSELAPVNGKGATPFALRKAGTDIETIAPIHTTALCALSPLTLATLGMG